MDVKNYIESGILELYVMGKLSETETREVAQNIAQYPEIKAEVDAIEAAIEEYALLHQIQPSPGGFAAIQQKINNNNSSTHSKSSSSLWSVIGAILAVLGTIAIILFWNGRNTHRLQMANMQSQLDTCQQNLNLSQNQIASLRDSVNLLQGVQTIYMDGNSPGTNKAPRAIAAIEWNENTGEFSVNPLSLPPTRSDKDYQLWAIVDGQPVDMLVFNTDADPNAKTTIAFTSRPTAFAVTLEPKGGSPSPTLSEMYVLGAV